MIDSAFGSSEALATQLKERGVGHFSNGWVWLLERGGKLEIGETHDGDTFADQDANPLLVIDLWEHAYYLDRQNARPAYLEAAIGVLNWEFAAENLARGTAWEYPAELALQAPLLLVREHVEGEIDADHALQSTDRLIDSGLEMTADRAARRGQRDDHVDDAVGVHLDRTHHLELDDVAAQLRVDDGAQRFSDLFCRGHAIHSSRSELGVWRGGGAGDRGCRAAFVR